MLADVENMGTPALADLDDIINPLVDFIAVPGLLEGLNTAPTQSGCPATTTPTCSSWVKRPRLMPAWNSARPGILPVTRGSKGAAWLGVEA